MLLFGNYNVIIFTLQNNYFSNFLIMTMFMYTILCFVQYIFSGSVTCYLEPKIFKRNSRTGTYATEELWLPIKDITTTVAKTTPSNNNNYVS